MDVLRGVEKAMGEITVNWTRKIIRHSLMFIRDYLSRSEIEG